MPPEANQTGNTQNDSTQNDSTQRDNTQFEGSKTFTQDQVNAMMKKEKDAHTARLKSIAEELDNFKSIAEMNGQQREELDTRLATLQNDLLTKEQISQREKDKMLKKHSETVTELEGQVKHWRDRFTSSQIDRAILDAAHANGAFSPKQMVKLIGGDTRLVEVLGDDGKPTGELIPKTTLEDMDESGKPITLDLTVPEAVARMKDMDEWANLFKGNGVSGFGGTQSSNHKKVNLRGMDPKAYIEARKQGLNLDTERS